MKKLILLGIALPLATFAQTTVNEKVFDQMKANVDERRNRLSLEEKKELESIQLTEEQKLLIYDQMRLQLLSIKKFKTQILKEGKSPQGSLPTNENDSSNLTEGEMTSWDLANEDLSRIDLTKVTQPFPTKFTVGMQLPWFYPFAVTTNKNGDYISSIGARPSSVPKPTSSQSQELSHFLIWGETKLNLEKLSFKDKDITLHIIDDQKRKFSVLLVHWLTFQHTQTGENSEVAQLNKKRLQGSAIVFNRCIETIGPLKEKCFEIPFNKNPRFTNCPNQSGFPDYINESLKFLCGYVQQPTVTFKKAYKDDQGDIYLVDADLETLYFMTIFKIAGMDSWAESRIHRIESRKEMEERRAPMLMEMNPLEFGSHIDAADREKNFQEVARLVSEAHAAKKDNNQTQLTQLMQNRMASGKGAVVRHFLRQGDWNFVLQYYVIPDSFYGTRINGETSDVPWDIRFLKALFSHDFGIKDAIQKDPQYIKKMEAFLNKHKIHDTRLNFEIYRSQVQGGEDPARDLIIKMGLGPDFEKLKSLLANPEGVYLNAAATEKLIAKYPFIVEMIHSKFKQDGKYCEIAVEAELKSEYFERGLCRLYPPVRERVTTSNCLPRRKYPPDGMGYADACEANFRKWVKSIYPQHFKDSTTP